MVYIDKRLENLRYDKLIAEDLDLGTGAVEGAIKNIIGKRCDHGGMRWIRERVEAIVQLRCIEANGDFERFVEFVHHRLFKEPDSATEALIVRLQSTTPAEPTHLRCRGVTGADLHPIHSSSAEPFLATGLEGARLFWVVVEDT